MAHLVNSWVCSAFTITSSSIHLAKNSQKGKRKHETELRYVMDAVMPHVSPSSAFQINISVQFKQIFWFEVWAQSVFLKRGSARVNARPRLFHTLHHPSTPLTPALSYPHPSGLSLGVSASCSRCYGNSVCISQWASRSSAGVQAFETASQVSLRPKNAAVYSGRLAAGDVTDAFPTEQKRSEKERKKKTWPRI